MNVMLATKCWRLAERLFVEKGCRTLTGVTSGFFEPKLEDMAMPKKTFLNAEGQLVKKCMGDCGAVLPVAKFSKHDNGKYIVYESKCRDCKSIYNRKWNLNREKGSRRMIAKLETTLEDVRAVITNWKEVIEFAQKHPLASGFKTPQEFVLSTLKTVYDGRQKENLRP